jgi:hypothetical protein
MKRKVLSYIIIIVLIIIDAILIIIEDNTMYFPKEYSIFISAILAVTIVNLIKIIINYIKDNK